MGVVIQNAAAFFLTTTPNGSILRGLTPDPQPRPRARLNNIKNNEAYYEILAVCKSIGRKKGS